MPRIRVYPHRTAPPESVTWGGWWTERRGPREPLPRLLVGWDYASRECLGVTVSIDRDRFLDGTGLRRIDQLEVVVLVDCKDAQERFVSRVPLREGADEIDLVVEVPPGRAAGTLRLVGHVLLAQDLPRTGGRVAHAKGSILSSSTPVTVALEGEASRFPTEPSNFSELGLPRAPWTVITNYLSLSDSFMGTVRFLVNLEHPVGRMALDPTDVHKVAPLMRAETMRLLLSTAADSMDDLESDPGLEDDSVGAVLESMCQLFLNRGLEQACELVRSDSVEFERLVHEQMRPLDEVFA